MVIDDDDVDVVFFSAVDGFNGGDANVDRNN